MVEKDPHSKAVAIAEVMNDKKAKDVVVLDLRGVCSVTDFFVIGTGTSSVHIGAIADGVMEALKDQGIAPRHTEGMKEGRWVLLDYGDVVVHIFAEREREFYALERLWRDALEVKARA